MIIYEKHLLNTIDDSRVIYELITHCRDDDKILCFDINSQKENFDILVKNVKYHNRNAEVIISNSFNEIKNYSRCTGILFVCAKRETLNSDEQIVFFKKYFNNNKIIGLQC